METVQVTSTRLVLVPCIVPGCRFTVSAKDEDRVYAHLADHLQHAHQEPLPVVRDRPAA
jgi:predicted small metal-binding protein